MLRSAALSNKIGMRLFKNSFKLQNKDLRWYRDKYLGAVFVLCFLVAMSLLWVWPLPRLNAIRGASFLSVAGICLLVSPQRLFILLGGLAFVSVRAVVGVALYHSVAALGVGVASGAALYYLCMRKAPGVQLPYEIKDYSYAELAIDCAVLGTFLWVYVRFIR